MKPIIKKLVGSSALMENSEKTRILPYKVSTASQTGNDSFKLDDYRDLFDSTDRYRRGLGWWGGNVVVSIFNVIVLLSTTISLTLCVNSITSAKSDEYSVLIVCTSFAVVLSLLITGTFKLLDYLD